MKASPPALLLAAALQFAPGVLSADTASWKSRNIYFALTDRVARDGDDSGGGSCGNLGEYCGGTFAGIESKLDYIQGMGFDAIWLTPVVASAFPRPTATVSDQWLTRFYRYPWRISWVLGFGPILHQLQLRVG